MNTEEEIKAAAGTPMMAQYLAIKNEHKDYLLFYRLGDFYELFFDDAVVASKALDIALTKRGRYNDVEVPMCGVPFHAYESYLARLIKQGYKVAIVEQMEDPKEAKKRGAKSVVKRDVIRLVTAGTLTEDILLDSKKNNYIVGISKIGGALGLAWFDISTGDFYTQELALEQGGKAEKEEVVLALALARLAPVEIVLPDSYLQNKATFELFKEYKSKLSVFPEARFGSENAKIKLQKLFKVQSLDAFGSFSRAEISAAGALIDYVENTQKGQMPHIEKPVRVFEEKVMEIDAATRRNLELTESLGQDKNSSLLKTIDCTITGAGGRLLCQRLSAPLLDLTEINNRLDIVEFFCRNAGLRKEIRSLLKACPDMERAVSRITVRRGGPRDMAAIKSALEIVPKIKNLLSTINALSAEEMVKDIPDAVTNMANKIGFHANLYNMLADSLAEDLPLLARDGGFIKAGYSAALDEMRHLKTDSSQLLSALQQKYAEQTKIAALKIKFNNVIGYFIEVPAKFAKDILANASFIHRQSVLNAVRFTTVELTELENKIRGAEDKALAIELELYEQLTEEVILSAAEVLKTAKALAEADVGAALAELAQQGNYCRPKLDNSLAFNIEGGRHPVVEAALQKEQNNSFIANNCNLDNEQKIWLLTGPNMAGKSTFLRQNAIIAVMAQMGSFVPAKAAHIGLINKLFSRVGAADDLARGRSTFMVEMVETAGILNQADERSFVILDEIGRGTATFDGLSIAWSVVEYLHEVNRCRALFATHYHELTALETKLKNLSLHCMKIKEFKENIVFLHEVIAGVADRSYGVHVARLAGLPQAVLSRSEEILKLLEKGDESKNLNRLIDDLPLFAALKEEKMPEKSELDKALDSLNPDGLSPKEALELMYKIKELYQKQ